MKLLKHLFFLFVSMVIASDCLLGMRPSACSYIILTQEAWDNVKDKNVITDQSMARFTEDQLLASLHSQREQHPDDSFVVLKVSSTGAVLEDKMFRPIRYET